MNYKMIFKTTSSALLLEAAAMLICLFSALIYRESILPYVYAIVPMLVIALPLFFMKGNNDPFNSKDGYVTVGGIWILFSVFGALPFWFCGHFPTFADCIFETVSGFTTTGASVLTSVEVLPKGLLLWRSLTQWLGGMGILVLITAFLPKSGEGALYLMRAEVPGPTSDKLVPRLANSSKILYAIYTALTLLQTAALCCTGMPFFDSLTNSLTTMSTGGFCIRDGSYSAYNNLPAEIITTIFMYLASLNYGIFFCLITRRVKDVLKNSELRFYTAMLVFFILLMTFNLVPELGFADALRHSSFNILSLVTTTGFSSCDFELWPLFSKIILVICMTTGGCAGSTAGGVKCSRVLMLLKSIVREIKQILHPRSVNVIRLDGKVVDEKVLTSVFQFFSAFVVIYLLTVLTISLDNLDFTGTFTAVLSCISNIGPGLGSVGPMSSFAAFSPFSKIVLSLCMLIGRLEIFPILIFFYRRTWKNV